MLNLYFRDFDYDKLKSNKSVVWDVEKEFGKIRDLKETEDVMNIISYVDSAVYLGNGKIRTMFGGELFISELSTGCKAVLLAALMPDKIISFLEAGDNARDAAFKFVKNGNIIVNYTASSVDYCDSSDSNIDVKYRDLVFSRLKRLSIYLSEEFDTPFGVDFDIDGVKKCEKTM